MVRNPDQSSVFFVASACRRCRNAVPRLPRSSGRWYWGRCNTSYWGERSKYSEINYSADYTLQYLRVCVLSCCKALIDFFGQEPFEDRRLEHYDKDGNVNWIDYKRMANRLPTIILFAKHIKVNVS